MFCKFCHAEISPSHKKCPVCSQPIKAEHSSCPNCQADLEPDTVSCATCGYHLLLKKVIQLHEDTGAPPPQTTLICPSCKKEIPLSSHFCEFCGSDIHPEPAANSHPAASPPPSHGGPTSAPETKKTTVGFNQATFNALIKLLDEKGVVKIDDLESQLSE